MPRSCSICKSKWLADIDAALVRGEAYRTIAKQYGCSEPAMFRHKNSHLPQKLALAKRRQDMLSAETLLQQMQDLTTRLWRGLEAAEKAGSPPAQVAFAREVRQCLESYSGIFNATRAIQSGAGGDSLAQRIAAARKRRAEARGLQTEESQSGESDLAGLLAVPSKPV